MKLEFLDWTLLLIYLALTFFVGFALHKKASENIQAFFLGGRTLPWWALGASGMASNVDVAGTMVISALVYALGTKALYIEIRGGMVLVLAFFLAFLGKWTRRAQVLTSAEWMKLRFGEGREGRLARLISAVANLVSHVWIISYFAVGGGKFFSAFLGIDERLASSGLILLTLFYAVASGFYGVVWTDVFQGLIILAGILYLVVQALQLPALPEVFSVSLPTGQAHQFVLSEISWKDWSSAWPPAHLNLPGEYAAFNPFHWVVGFYFLKTCIEGLGGAGGYMSQRYLAAASDRDAGLLSLIWIFLLSFRWPLVAAIAVLGIHYAQTQGPLADPELVLPTVLMHYAPSGIRGLLVACFMAAAMSTFVAIINASAAYWVKDIYQAHLNPKASEKTLLWHSRAASVVIVLLGLLFSLPVVNINDIWGWLTMAFGAGLFVPLALRWYWWRYNGFGFAAGTLAGMCAAIGTRYLGLALPEYMNFVVPASVSLLGCLLGTYLTPATASKTLVNFYSITEPFGIWGPVRAALPQEQQRKILKDNRQDLLSVFIAVPWMIALALLGILWIVRRTDQAWMVTAAFLVLSGALYKFWYRRL